ncbi:hypothetical protein SAMN05216216_14216 [Lacicoccus qingdaonensis]|uniref:UBA domain-containing protein n=1 Tax=Lacicoccus qingdaonensis TaxID=576118 RepID=A0A1G9J4M6_9BACL|nr:hypothetical protein SAMN05216216_14216 [Salinicoccus qingdaonensis]
MTSDFDCLRSNLGSKFDLPGYIDCLRSNLGSKFDLPGDLDCLRSNLGSKFDKSKKEDSDDFSEEILSDLIDEGYKGEELKAAFAERRAMLTSAVDNLIEEARNSKSYDSFEDMLEDTVDEEDED